MSGATYRIELARDAHNTNYPWEAHIIRLSDEEEMEWRRHESIFEASEWAREWVATESKGEGIERRTYYVDDEGQDADAPHSVKA